jgi:hypothetical protein
MVAPLKSGCRPYVNDTVVNKLLPTAVALRIALVVLTPTALPVVTVGSTVVLVSSSTRLTSSGNADGEKPVIDGRLDAEHGPEAAELMPMSTSSLPSRVITGPPESPEQMPVVAVCTAVKPPGHVGDVLSGWSIE